MQELGEAKRKLVSVCTQFQQCRPELCTQCKPDSAGFSLALALEKCGWLFANYSCDDLAILKLVYPRFVNVQPKHFNVGKNWKK